MSLVRMRTDLHPLCQRHHTPMAFVELWLRAATDTFPIPAYASHEVGCTPHFNVIHAYFDASEGKGIQRDMKAWLKCSSDGLPMYISEFDPTKNRHTWQCSQFGCDGSQVTEGPRKS